MQQPNYVPEQHSNVETPQSHTAAKSLNPTRLKILLILLGAAICVLIITTLQGNGLNNITLSGLLPERMAFSGSGTENNPYRIRTAQDLARISTMVENGTDFARRHFVLENDIDLAEFLSEGSPGYNNGAGWLQIGRHYRLPFSGHFDGAGNTISGLWINRGSEPHIGLFGFISETAEIRNLRVEVAEGKSVTGGLSIGVLVGLSSGGIIESCYVSGVVMVETKREFAGVGGMIGSTYHESVIVNSEANVSVYAGITSENGLMHAGGLVGRLNHNSSVANSIARGNVMATGYGSYAGGLVGAQRGGSIVNSSAYGNVSSYAIGEVWDTSSLALVGGLVGWQLDDAVIIDSIAHGDVVATGFETFAGGLVGRQRSATIINSMAYGNVTSYSTGTRAGNGGLVGIMDSVDDIAVNIIAYSSASGDVSGDGQIISAGGLVGIARIGSITNSYATGNVSAIGRLSAYAGGLIGVTGITTEGTIVENCYAIGSVFAESDFGPVLVGGLAGSFLDYARNFVSSYFDVDTTGQEFGYRDIDDLPGTSAIAKHTPDMIRRETFIGWDFENVWDIIEGESYPFLRGASNRGNTVRE
jgi:hypothetical protein